MRPRSSSVYRLRDQLGQPDPATRDFLVAAANTAARRWTEKDQGIWEIRGPAQGFAQSRGDQRLDGWGSAQNRSGCSV